MPDGTTKISYQPIQRNALSAIQKVEIVVPVHKGLPKVERWAKLITELLIFLPIKTLLFFWFVASWFPQLGITYWQLLLPVYLAGIAFRPFIFRGRWIPENRLFKTRFDHGGGLLQETLYESKTPITENPVTGRTK